MNAPELIKLTKAGDTLTMLVMSCALVPVGKYPEYGFTGTANGKLVTVQVNKASAERQFTRLDLTPETATGKTLVFTRDPNPSDPTKPYWGINYGESNGAAHAAPHTPHGNGKQGIDIGHVPGLDDGAPPHDDADAPDAIPVLPAGPAADKLNAMFKLYDACWVHAIRRAELAPGLKPDVAAMTATLFIAANSRGFAA